MAFKLPRFNRADVLVDEQRRPTINFHRWWQEVLDRIEIAFEDIVTVLGIAQSKNRTFTGTSEPTADAVGDLWIDTDDNNKLYRWNGVGWVAYRDGGASRALDGLNSDGTVATDKVVNDSIAAGAVISTPTINNSSSTTISSGGYTWMDCDDITFDASGNSIIIMCDFNVEVVDNCKYKYRLRYGGSTLGREVGPITANTADQPPGTIVRVFTPSAGSVTVTLQAACNDANDIVVHDPVFVVMDNRNV